LDIAKKDAEIIALEMKTIAFCGFKFKVLCCPLFPKDRIIAFSNRKHAKTFIETCKVLDRLIKLNKLILLEKKPKKRITVP